MINWIVTQPLIGGMPIGFENAFGVPPLAIITCGFVNDTHYIQYKNTTQNNNIPIIRMTGDYSGFTSKEDEDIYNSILDSHSIDILN